MYELDALLDLFFEHVKHLFFPEEWLQIDLKFSKYEIFALLFIEKRRKVTMSALSESVNVPMSTANGLAERLIKKGYVARDRNDADRRIVELRLTEKGTQFIADIKGMMSAYFKMVLDELSEEEIRFLVDIVLKIVRGLQKKFSAGPSSADRKIRKIDIQ